ncbi:MAG: iron-containing redox enzyme family protein [Myxococcales bacterium]
MEAIALAAPVDPRALHLLLARFNQRRLRPSLPCASWREELREEAMLRELEGDFVESERSAVAERARTAPSDPDAFVRWFEELRETGPGQGDPLFPWLKASASLADMRWFLDQEVAGEAGFDDLVALAQVKMPVRAKLELARNYWDEMGRGSERAMHGPLLGNLARVLDVDGDPARVVWEANALANLLVALAANRRYAYHAIGALGAIEMTAPGRVAQVDEGLARLGIPAGARRYFSLHAVVDLRHSASWNAEVIEPLVAAEPRAARAIAEGALLRLRAGARCYARYREHFGV